ncbi:hypothetical protein PRIPAC_87230 [Pristionchus pacificus]|nr:hypothetical protein PRIPAC_87230 [Pristionchus pacificus]
MGIFRRVFMNVVQPQQEERLKRSGVPAIPVDIGYKGGKETQGAKESGVLSQAVSNPGVVVGLGLTTMALLGMLRKSFIGDKAGAQKYMQYRIMAQFFTITMLVAGVTVFGAVYESKEEREKREDAERLAALKA